MSETPDPRAQRIGAAALRNLAEQAAKNQQAGAAARAEILAICADYTGPDRLTARRIQELLTRALSVRRIQEHISEIKNAESSVSR